MGEITERLEKLRGMAEQLVKVNNNLRQSVQRLEEALEELQREKASLQTNLDEKLKQIDILQTAKSLNLREDKEEARKQIDDLLREIEECLTLLDS